MMSFVSIGWFDWTFLQPSGLWWLLAVPLFVVLALPARPRHQLDSGHFDQWLRAERRLGRRPPKVFDAGLVLLLVAAACCAVAVAEPWQGRRNGATGLTVVFDRSPSMASPVAMGGASAHDELALQLMRDLALLPKEVDVRVATVGASVELWSKARVDQLRAGDLSAMSSPWDPAEFEATSATGDVDAEMLSAHTVATQVALVESSLADAASAMRADSAAPPIEGSRAGRVVWLYTDGRLAADGMSGRIERVASRTFGVRMPAMDGRTKLPNTGVIAIRFADRWPEIGLTANATVHNFGSESAAVRVTADGAWSLAKSALANPFPEDAVFDPSVGEPAGKSEVRLAPLAPGETRELAIELMRSPAGGRARLAFASDDVFPVDDEAVVVLAPRPAPHVVALGAAEGGPWLATAADAVAAAVDGRVVSDAAAVGPGGTASGGSSEGSSAAPSFVLLDGGTVGLHPGERPMLSFGTTFVGGAKLKPQPVDDVRPWIGPEGLDWDRDDPLTRGLDLSALLVDLAFPGVLPSGRPLVWCDEGPLVVVVKSAPQEPGETGRPVASIHAAFRLGDTNLPLLGAFPRFLRRALLRSFGAGDGPSVVGGLVLAPRVAAVEGALAVRIDPTSANSAGAASVDPSAGAKGLGSAFDAAAFAAPGRSLAAWLLMAALLCLALRAWRRAS